MLEVEGINTYYGRLRVLQDVSLKVNDGEFIIVFGPNGHGKTTLLKTICGLLKPASGSLLFDGEDITALPTSMIVEKGVVYIAEKRHLFLDMSVLANLKLGSQSSRSREELNENLSYVFQLFPVLERYKNRLTRTLSGGESQMVAIGRGLMSSAKFLAIDEPSFGLAPILRSEVFKTIDSIHKTGRSVLMVEQVASEVAGIADRLYLMEDGKIVLEGTEKDFMSCERVRKVYLGL